MKKIVYIKDTDYGFPLFYAKLRNLSAISIEKEHISYIDFKELFNKNKKFYEGNKENDFYYIVPNDKYIENDIKKKIIKDFEINILSRKYNLSITDREVYDEIKKYIEEFKTKEDLESFLKKRYNVDLNFFQEKYIKSYLLANKLDSYIKNDEKINKDSFKKIELAYKKINEKNSDFYKIANEYNNTDNLKESNGSIGWISIDRLFKSFNELNGVEIKRNLTTNILKNDDGFYIIRIEAVDTDDLNNKVAKVAMIKISTMNLDEYLQKQFNNIRIKEYIK